MDAAIEVAPVALDLGPLATGSALIREIEIASVEDDTLYLEEMALDGDGVFGVDESGTERILAPGARTSVRVSCVPGGEGAWRGVYRLGTNARSDCRPAIPLYCAGVAVD